MLYALFFSGPQWLNPLIAFLAFVFSLVFAFWFTKRLQRKGRPWSISAPLLSFAVLITLTARMWIPFVWVVSEGLFNPVRSRTMEEGLATLVLFMPFILLLFLAVFLIQLLFSKAVYKYL